MTIRKHEDFGKSISRPLNLIELQDDRDIARRYLQRIINDDSDAGDAVNHNSSFTVAHGSIAQALGIERKSNQKKESNSSNMIQVSLDLIKIEYRTIANRTLTHELIGAGSVLLERTRLCNTFLIVSNSGIVNGRDIFPRAHPNDGLLDVLEIDSEISLRQRLVAWHKARIGVHLPHPQLHVSRHTQFEWAGHPSRMVVDGASFHKVDWLRCSIVKDAISICF